MIIQVKKRISDNFGDSINEIFNIMLQVERIRPSDVENIVFDLSECSFSYPYLLAALHTLAREYRKRHYKVSFKLNFNTSYGEYLSLVHFPDGLIPENFSDGRFENLIEQYAGRTYIPLTSFSTSKERQHTYLREKFISTLLNIIHTQCNLNGNMRSAVSYLIDEAINNILEHSQAEQGCVFAQYYPTKNFMDVCIADNGISILKSYQNKNMAGINTDKVALQSALNGVSTKDDVESRGFGISTSKKMLVKGLRGIYFLYSGRAFHIDSVEKKDIVELPESLNLRWQGTIVFMRIPLIINETFNYLQFVES